MEGLLLPLLLMLVVAVPLFLGSRKQKAAVQKQQELQNNLTEGDRVMTTSGLYATVADTSDDLSIDLEIAPGVVTTWLRQAVREKVEPVVEDELDDDAEGSADELTTASLEVKDEDDKKESVVAAGEQKSTAQVAPPLEHGKK